MDRDHLGLVITAACLLGLMALSPMSGLFGNGYVVTPATDADIEGLTPSDTVRVSFWDLPPRVMILSAVLSISPLLLFPVELLFFVKGFTLLGYRKITARNVLASPARLQVYEAIRADPGIYFNELARTTGLNRGTLRYHLALLKATGKISALAIGGDTRYYENSGKFTDAEQKVLKFLRNDRERAILACLVDNPATTRGDLEQVLEISGSSVTWHTNRLRNAGILSVVRDGKTNRYILNPEIRCLIRKYLPVPVGTRPAAV